MRTVLAAMNMSLDGRCDHRDGIADEALHDMFTELLLSTGTLIYGRVTYELMESAWPEMVKHPTGNASLDAFARSIDAIEKVVFSRTLKSVSWNNSYLATDDLQTVVQRLRALPGKPIAIGSPGMIAQMHNLNLIDEYIIAVHPVVSGRGPMLFPNPNQKIELKLERSNVLDSGVVVLHYRK